MSSPKTNIVGVDRLNLVQPPKPVPAEVIQLAVDAGLPQAALAALSGQGISITKDTLLTHSAGDLTAQLQTQEKAQSKQALPSVVYDDFRVRLTRFQDANKGLAD